MIQTLSIKNVALITELTIDFSEGFNVLLGETGAGKSIIFDALNFVLGGKADKSLIRYGENQMRVDAVFSNLSETCKEALREFGYEDEEICLSRLLTTEGKATIRINGIPATATILKEVGKYLVDTYSQHESVELLKPKYHLAMLDKFAGDVVAKQKEVVKDAYSLYTAIVKQIESFGGSEFERERMRSLLQYQIDEIENANLNVGEEEEISQRLKFLNSAEKIFQSINTCEELLNDSSTSCIRALSEASSSLASLSNFENIEQCRQRLESARYEIEDIVETLSDIKSMSEYDEHEFARLDRRHDLIKSLSKKYGGSEQAVLSFLEEAKIKLNGLNDSEFLLSKLEKEKTSAFNALASECEKLTELRKNSAKNIAKQLCRQLQELGMKSSQFNIKFDQTSYSVNGQDNVEFEFSANKGLEVKSLAKTASGGELSRFMLALKNVFNSLAGPQTLVFDEIDSGISGETGNIVGEKIDKLSKSSQILCITHLPQVAVYADSIYVVSKEEDDKTTKTKVELVADEDVIKCLAKMTVGDNVTDTAKKQAQEMRIKAGKA